MTGLPEEPREFEVAGGHLHGLRLAPDGGAPTLLAIHGITSNSRSWLAVSRALGESTTLLAVDLRGRGASHRLPGPFGISVHVEDMLAVLDQLGLEQAVVTGHSLGAYIAAELAARHPNRVKRLVLVDGGLTIPGTEGSDPEAFLEAFLGPALARLQMTFPDLDAYQAWWSEHPALRDADVDEDVLRGYAEHDLTGSPPELRSSVNPDAVRCDGSDLFSIRGAESIAVPAVLLAAPRGLLNEPNPMQPISLVEAWAQRDGARRHAQPVPDVNHYSILMGRRGASAVAEAIRAATLAA